MTHSNFEHLSDLGRDFYRLNRIDEAIDRFKQAFLAKTDQQDLQLIIDASIDLSRCYIIKRLFKKSYDVLKEAQAELSRERKKRRELRMIKYSLYTAFGDHMIAVAEKKEEKDYKSLLQCYSKIDDALKYYQKCVEITSSRLLDTKLEQSEKQEWSDRYAATIINMMNPILVEINISENKRIAQAILKQSEKLLKFNRQCEPNIQKRIEKNISKCKFMRGASLSSLKRYAEAEKLLKEDYEFCEGNHEVEDLERTRKELLKLYLNKEEMGKAKKMLKNADERLTFNSLMKEYERIENYLRQMKKSSFLLLPLSKQKQNIEKFQSILIQEQNRPWAYKFCEMASVLIRVSKEKEIIYLLSKKASQFFLGQDQYSKALEYLQGALKHCQNHQNIDYYNDLLREATILFYLKSETERTQGLFEQCRQLAKRLSIQKEFEDQIQVLKLEVRRMEKYENMRFQTETQKQLLSLMNEQEKQQELINEEGSRGFRTSFMVNQRRSDPENPKQKLIREYREHCEKSEFQIEIRKGIIQKIRNFSEQNSYQIRLQQIMSADEAELFLLITLFQIKKWNFENSSIKHPKHFIEALMTKSNTCQVESLKFSQVFIDRMEVFLNLLKSLTSLEVLCLSSCFTQKKMTELKIPQLGLQYPERLKILKLRSAYLDDSSVKFLGEFINLQTLNLRANNLKGNQFHSLSKMKCLINFNISDNPIENGSLELSAPLIKKLKVKNLKRVLPAGSFVKVMEKCVTIDLSENSEENIVRMIRGIVEFSLAKEKEMKEIREIRLKRVTLTETIKDEISEAVLWLTQLRKIDLRMSKCHNGESEFYFSKQSGDRFANYFKNSKSRKVEVLVHNRMDENSVGDFGHFFG